MKSQIGRWGNSLAWRIPKHIVEELSLESNDEVDCHVEDGKIIIEPVSKQKDYTLDELLAQIIEPSQEVCWGKPEGNEVW
ncbi:AbrB/MazE/SpoVT family DNA-binding domain-containing protein [Gloeocapsopsis crepidinum LEGE 06123]|uniref:AbrB/MazE/SpoVT family DNA-binding domain-containing protein n=1 Tax=Gloeocapsopsis crepidinum LEGE 06123 TaxID=588587 RepID=A0ABR9UWT3_9CHRO|nr:AbrB/MazE/SpoVT family DNA-binding domain-containing protein [Gloeocapsopsis crepidinum]MBE9192757.1 AbrB/MazE/SpoVT family DNA-binding domain-containing protein [Gloeocapsopsis crepidinum LEGE 06123]